MTGVKSVWASVQNSPVLMRRVNGWLTLFWIVMTPVSYFLGWLDSVTYVSALSLWALVTGHWSAWQAARVEVRQEQELQAAADQDLPGDIVERLTSETDIQPTGEDPTGQTCSHCGQPAPGTKPVPSPAVTAATAGRAIPN